MIAKIKEILGAKIFLVIILIFSASSDSFAQVEFRWLDVGSFHNFYSNLGTEIEEGFIPESQAGWQWPAIYNDQDAQVSKGLWLGVKNFADSAGNYFPVRVAQTGPRVSRENQFFPVEMKTISKFAKPEVFVNNTISEKHETQIDEIDSNLKGDRVIHTKINTVLGIQIERTIRQFSQQYHDNYHIIEYVFTNTGNTDEDEEIELPDQNIEGFIPFFITKLAPVKQTRYVIGNATGWGINTMIDRRGDGLKPEELEKFRAHYIWHGYFPSSDVEYDNIGGPIFLPNISSSLSPDDTTGRLGAYHFMGTVTLHADASATNSTDDRMQPFTMTEVHSYNNTLNQWNHSVDSIRMSEEYELMNSGRTQPRHAFLVEPNGYEGFTSPTGDPAMGSYSGGFSYVTGYGPYSLSPGESVNIVVAEATSGIDRHLANEMGIAFKNGEITAQEKNRVVFQGRDSLFQTFERAIANFRSGYYIPSEPIPPTLFEVISTDQGIRLNWEFHGDENEISGFEIYRAHSDRDSTYHLVYKASSYERIVFDTNDFRASNPEKFYSDTPELGEEYYYYIVSVSKNINLDATGETPTGSRLKSNRYYTQTYDPIRAFAGVSVEEEIYIASKAQLFQNFPNPFNPTTTISYYLPNSSELEISVYNLMGQKVATLFNGRKSEGMHEITWNAENTASGIYFYQLKTDEIRMNKRFILLK